MSNQNDSIKFKNQRNDLIQFIFSLKEIVKEDKSWYSHSNNKKIINEKLDNFDIIDSDFIKEHLISFLQIVNHSEIQNIAKVEAGKERIDVINNIITEIEKNHSKDSNFKNLSLIFKNNISEKSKFFYLFFDALEYNDIRELYQIDQNHLDNFVEKNFKKILDLLVCNT